MCCWTCQDWVSSEWCWLMFLASQSEKHHTASLCWWHCCSLHSNLFASTVQFYTLHILLTLVALENLKCHQMNVNNVFIKFFLKKIIYMTLSSDIEVASDCALCIMWSLYELKQVTRDWHKWCVAELVKIEFHQSDADSCFLLHSQKSIILLLYVDDIVVVFTATSAVT